MDKEKFINILVFGDSIAWGFGDSKKGGWVDRLKAFFHNDEYIKRLIFYTVYNLGIGGDTTDFLLERFKNEVEAREEEDPKIRKTDIIIFAIGVNDSNFLNSKDNSRVNLKNFQKNLKELINQAKEFTKKIIFIGLSEVDESKTAPTLWNKASYWTNENIKEYNSVIKSVCQRNKIMYLDMFGLLKSSDLADGLHSNSQGHQKIFERVKDFLLENKLVEK